MKLTNKRLLTTTSLALTLLATASTALAGFQYNPSELLIGFRVTPNSGASSSFELVVNGGAITNYSTLATGQSITITDVQNLLPSAFGDLNNLSWSAFADVSTNAVSGGTSNYPLHTLWVTNPRSDNNTQSSPWNADSYFGQGNVVARIEGLGGNDTTYGSTHPTGSLNTNTAVVVPANDPLFSYTAYIGANGNFRQAFTGNVEQGTPATFTTDGLPVRSDLNLLLPGNGGAATYLGYLELSPTGVLVYHAGPSAVTIPQPQIISITRTGSTTAVTFGPTTSSANYSLFSSTNLASPRSSWSVVGSPAAGTGSNMTINDTTSSAQTFYLIKAQ